MLRDHSVQPVLLASVHSICVAIGGGEEIQNNNQDIKLRWNHYFLANSIYFMMVPWWGAVQSFYWYCKHSKKYHFVQRLTNSQDSPDKKYWVGLVNFFRLCIVSRFPDIHKLDFEVEILILDYTWQVCNYTCP